MSKDHVPSDFSRSSGYKSDLERAETGSMVKSINTSFGSKNHNAYIMRSDGTHEHFYYSPKTQKSGWHGHKYPTKNNHPDLQSKAEGAKDMEINSFLESIKADKATLARLNDVSKNAAQNANTQAGKKSGHDGGGRERGDSSNAPLSQGRESGNKAGPAPTSHSAPSQGHSSNGQGSSAGHASGGQAASSGHGSGGASSGGGHSSGDSGTGGHGSGGQGGSGGHGSPHGCLRR